jgi:uncharacterized iron-regulated membrane protein
LGKNYHSFVIAAMQGTLFCKLTAFMKKNLVFYIHSFTGLISGLFILLMSLSGSALMFHEELDKLQYPGFAVEKDKQLLSVDSFYHSLQKTYPRAQVSNCAISETVHEPFIFIVYDSSYMNGSKSMQVFFHPQTAQLLGTRGNSSDLKHNPMSWLGTFHNSFHLKKTGEWLLGFFAVLFVISLITGLLQYRRNIWPVISFRRDMFRRRNLHQLIGVWALLFNLMIAVTGFWMQRYVFKKTFYQAQGNSSYTRVIKPSPPLFFGMDSALQQVKKQHPLFNAYVIYFAQSMSGKTAVYGSQTSNSFIHSKKFADAVFLDSAGSIARTAFVNEIPGDNRYDIINSQVHFGRFGGWPVKILYTLFGLSGAVLSITGSLLWWRRRKGK